MTDDTTATITFWVAIDADSNTNIDTDNAEDAVSGVSGVNRVFEVTMRLPLPKATQVSATIPDTDGPVTVTVA